MKRDIRHLELIIKYCTDVEDSVSMFGADEEDFYGSVQYQHCCAFQIAQIGERVKRLSSQLVAKYSEIEWKDIAGFRDVLSHDYDNIDMAMFWRTVSKDVPKLKRDCETILTEIKNKSY
jgi:uncharacterized protein with HEPN domain